MRNRFRTPVVAFDIRQEIFLGPELGFVTQHTNPPRYYYAYALEERHERACEDKKKIDVRDALNVDDHYIGWLGLGWVGVDGRH